MGKIRTKTVKRAGKKMVEAHFGKLSRDFYVNKRVVFDNTIGTSKKLKNKPMPNLTAMAVVRLTYINR